MRKSIELFLSQYLSYWKVKSKFEKVTFNIKKRVYMFAQSAADEKKRYLTLRSIARNAIKQIVFSVLLTAVIIFINKYLGGVYEWIGIKNVESRDYVTFLATISGIGGVFIGLYYTAISTVGSTIYSKVPSNVRELLVHELYGNVYMRFLSVTTFLGIIFIALSISGFGTVYLAIPIMTFSSGIGIICFVKLGQQVFYFFDPTSLSGYVFDELNRTIKLVKCGGLEWDNPSFQEHSHRMSLQSINSLEVLSKNISEESHLNGRSFVLLSEKIYLFLSMYLYSKKKIPANSKWYKQVYKHDDWYRSNFNNVLIAQQTGTTLEPTIFLNRDWVEQKLLGITFLCVTKNIENYNYRDVLDFIENQKIYLITLSQEGEVERALKNIEIVGDIIFDRILCAEKNIDLKEEGLEVLWVVQSIVYQVIDVYLKHLKSVEKLSETELKNKIDTINWVEEKNIYSHGFPSYCLGKIEWLQKKIKFEFLADGVKITPNWYIYDLVFKEVSDKHIDNINVLTRDVSSLFKKWVSKVDANYPLIKAVIVSGEWEYWHKYQNFEHVFFEKIEELSLNNKVKDLEFEKIEREKVKALIVARKGEVINSMSSLVLALPLRNIEAEFPDYSGQFLHALEEEILNSIINNDSSSLKKNFRALLFGGVSKYSDLLPDNIGDDGLEKMHEFKVASSIFMDVIDLSGYCFLLSEYFENSSLWDAVKGVWSEYIDAAKDRNIPQFLALVIELSQDGFGFPYRSMIRQRWGDGVSQVVSNVKKREVDSVGHFGYKKVIVEHKSDLVKFFASHMEHYNSIDGVDIFISYFLNEIHGGDKFNFGRRGDLLKDVAVEVESQNKIIKDNNKGADNEI